MHARLRLTFSTLLLATVAGTSFLGAGCAPFARVSPPSEQPAGATVDPTVAGQTPVAPPLCVVLDDLTRRATEVARAGEFAHAHRLAATVLAMLDGQGSSGEGGEGLEADRYYRTIARMYVELLPESYADSVDESIAMLVFEAQMDRSYDSITVNINDTTIARLIACQRQTQYSVPMVINERVLRALAFFTRMREGQMARWIASAGAYLPMINKLVADSGLPADLAYLPLIESGFNPRAYSYAHASGIWQFIASTGALYGLRRGYWLDERRDPIRSTMSAIRFLRVLHNDFGDWYLALAAYNCGQGGVRRGIAGAGGNRDFWALKLPQQTMEYVPKYLAAVMVARNTSCFGMAAPDTALPYPDTVHISDCIDFSTIARGLSITVDTIEHMNPHMLRWCTPPDANDVILYLPSGTAERFREFVKTLDSSQKVRWQRYQVQSGDNLSTIARRFKTTIEALRSVNKIRNNRIVAGKHIFIPIAEHGAVFKAPPAESDGERPAAALPTGAMRYRVRTGETLSQIAETFNTSVANICRWNNLQSAHDVRAGTLLTIHLQGTQRNAAGVTGAVGTRPSAPTTGTRKTYVVQKGDNLSAIADALGVGLAPLCDWNQKDMSTAMIRPGDTLVYFVNDSGAGKPRRTEPSVSPAVPAQSRATPVGPAAAGDVITYEVQAGDNLSSIASLFYTTPEELAKANGLAPGSAIKAGALLKVRIRDTTGAAPSKSTKPRGKLIHYLVKKGDTLWGIAQLFGLEVRQVCMQNGLRPDAVLTPGDTLKLVLREDL